MSRKMLAILQKPAVFACLVIAFGLNGAVFAQDEQRPSSEELLPETTVAYVQLYNFREFMEKLADTNGGRLLADENVGPLANDLLKTAKEAYTEIEDRVGLSLEEIRELPAGEMCFAVIAPRRKKPAFVFIIDTDDESAVVEKALQRGRDLAEEADIELEIEETDDVTFEKFVVDGQDVMMFRKAGSVVIGTDLDEMNAIVDRWMGREVEKVKPLKENRKFITIMNRCRGTKDLPNDFRFFVDPISLVKSATRGNAGAQLALNFLPILGLDGFLGVGGSMIIDEMDFESVAHMHILLSNPRAGIFEMLALKPGEYEPQPWVPNNAGSYVSASLDTKKMFSELEKMYDSFSGDGAMNEEIEDEINSELGIDFYEDIIENVSGRMTYVQWVGDDAVAINGQTNAIAFGVNDTDAIMEIVDIFLERVRDEDGDESIEELEYKGVTYWQQPNEAAEEARERIAEGGAPTGVVRVPQPAFVMLEDSLIIVDNPDFLKRAIDTARGKEDSLYNDEQFQTVTDQITKLLGTDLPGAIMYNRPAEAIRMMLKVAKDDDAREFLEEMGEDNKYVQMILAAFEDNPLPDFDDISHYFPPSGGFMTNDDTGYHMLFFQQKSAH